ncbi:MAG: hypothetical protein JNK82_25775 [Myxococcaceae bacterium]|nr:hypothetical protein [Myxococcaceae bacterium]
MGPTLKARGQALVLFSLVLLVLVLATMATMSLAHLTHQKMELQVASDAAAYSQAVATSRAFNSVALLNRAQVATMVAMAGANSAVSFAGTYRAALNATYQGYVDEWNAEYCGCGRPFQPSVPRMLCGNQAQESFSDCKYAQHGMDAIDRQFCYGNGNGNGAGGNGNGGGSCQANANTCLVSYQLFGWGAFPPSPAPQFNSNSRRDCIIRESDRIKGVWQGLDDAAGLQSRMIQTEAGAYAGLQATALAEARATLAPFAQNAISVVGRAQPNGAALNVSRREFDNGHGGGYLMNSVEAAMGSRAHPFITLRSDGQRALQEAVDRAFAPCGAAGEVTIQTLVGNSYFAQDKQHGAAPASGYGAWSDEHSVVVVDYLGPDANAGDGAPGTPAGRVRFEGWVRSTDEQHTGDSHDWCPDDFQPEATPPDVRHTLLPHSVPASGPDPCAGSSCIWPSFEDTNAGNIADPGDVFGQPKLLATATKDLSGQSDPWNLFFRFRFSSSGPGERVDFRAEHAVQGVVPRLETLAAGISYYHRRGHWQEPPNLFNPYWRASLVRANIDDTGIADVGQAISPQNRAALNALVNAGYRGIP